MKHKDNNIVEEEIKEDRRSKKEKDRDLNKDNIVKKSNKDYKRKKQFEAEFMRENDY